MCKIVNIQHGKVFYQFLSAFTTWSKHGTAPILVLKTPKRGPFLLLWLSEVLRGYQEMLIICDFARREGGGTMARIFVV